MADSSNDIHHPKELLGKELTIRDNRSRRRISQKEYPSKKKALSIAFYQRYNIKGKEAEDKFLDKHMIKSVDWDKI